LIRKRVGLVVLVAGIAALAAGCGSSSKSGSGNNNTTTASSAGGGGGSCGTVSIGMQAPITGPAASIGSDQLHWAEFFISQWNADSSNSPKLKLVQADTQLDPAKASTTAQQLASNNAVVGVIGPAGSDEVEAVAPIFKKAGLAFGSGSATRVSLTGGKWKGYFFRDVPNDGVQGPTDADYMMSTLGVKKGDKVMVVDDQESYSTGLADIVQKELKAKGVTVDRESISQKATDFSSLAAKAGNAKVVFLPFQLSTQAQLFAQQLQAQGSKAVVFGSDGTFDSSKFKVDGSYISFFAPDVTTLSSAKTTVAAFKKAYPGGTSPFGAPNYVLAQMYATAISKICKNGDTPTRANVRAEVMKVSLPQTILGTPMSLTANGDVAGAKFHIFKIENGGKYVTVS
jgi:branched-chain amino acid transport system substrate-binding protein